MPVVLPADHVGDIGRDRLVGDEILSRDRKRPADQQHRRHAGKDVPLLRDQRLRIAGGDQRHHVAHEHGDGGVEQRDHEARDEQHREQPFGLPGKMPIEADQRRRRLRLARRLCRRQKFFKSLQHVSIRNESRQTEKAALARAASDRFSGSDAYDLGAHRDHTMAGPESDSAAGATPLFSFSRRRARAVCPETRTAPRKPIRSAIERPEAASVTSLSVSLLNAITGRHDRELPRPRRRGNSAAGRYRVWMLEIPNAKAARLRMPFG